MSLTAGSEDPSAAFDNPVKPPESLFGLMSPLVQMPPEDPDSSTPQAPEPELPMRSGRGLRDGRGLPFVRRGRLGGRMDLSRMRLRS